MLSRLFASWREKQSCLGLSGAGFSTSSDVRWSFYWLRTSKQRSFRDCWTPDISFDAAFLQLSKDQQERQQRAASQQQSPLITVRAISKNPDEGYKGLSLQRRFHYLFLSFTFFCVWRRKGTKEEPYWFKTSRTVKQQDTTDRSCMAGIRIKVERAWRRKHTTKETGDWQTFFFFFCGEKDGMKGLVIWKDRERTITKQRRSLLASVRLRSRSFQPATWKMELRSLATNMRQTYQIRMNCLSWY